MQLVLTTFDIAIISLIAATVTILLLLFGMSRGAKRQKFKLHHVVVYSAVVIQLLLVIFWMFPRLLWLISFGILGDLIGNWYIIVHEIVGFLALGIGLVISVIFLIKPGMPPALVKKTRRWMWVVLILWIIAFLFGIVNFYAGYLAG
ncbi:MAG: hypothetical protein C4K47_04875 [Candidatus Thorarchaeota archaeon]|nr:MAG: hypothetical protein C4K47_04875 [Candidatus Thorarchaeota archaeon]